MKELPEFFRTEINYATISHHKNIGQVERKIVYVETYLPCFVDSYDDENWIDLFLVELCYNNSFHASTQESLYNFQVNNSPKTMKRRLHLVK